MRMFLGTIDALATTTETDSDPIAALDEAVGWNKLLRVRDEVAQIAETADIDPLVRAANLVIAAIVWWNSTFMADAVDHLRAAGEPALDDLLAHTSPVGWEHIAFSGDFLWERAAAIPAGWRELTLRLRVRGAA
jgi:Tn3 transposase DDE domain